MEEKTGNPHQGQDLKQSKAQGHHMTLSKFNLSKKASYDIIKIQALFILHQSSSIIHSIALPSYPSSILSSKSDLPHMTHHLTSHI
jgi:hypothetical protein